MNNKGKKTYRLTVKLPNEVVETLSEVADRENTTISKLLEGGFKKAIAHLLVTAEDLIKPEDVRLEEL